MKKRAFSGALILGFVLILVFPLFPETITLIHSNDTHGTFKPYEIKANGKERLVGGMEAASHYINKIRTTKKNVLLIDLGDFMTGTLASEIEYKGVVGGAMIEFLNRLDYDVWCYGNHEFDKGKRNAQELARLAEFPAVMANIIYRENGKLFSAEPFHTFEVGGLKVGIIAVIDENFLMEVQKEKVDDLDVLPVVSTLNSHIPQLDKQTDLIVVLFHGWFEEGVKVARNVAGIDIVFTASEDGKCKEVNGILVKSTFGHQKTLGYIEAEVQDDKIVNYEEKLIWLWADVDMKPSAQVTAFVKEVDKLIGSEYAKVIGNAKRDLTIRHYPGKNAPVGSVLGNWITDVMRWKTGTQIGLHNSGAIRANIKAGQVTKANIFNVAPFHNTLVKFQLTGQQIKDVLEYDVERGWDRMQVSGLKYKYYPKTVRPYGKRVDYIEINGEILGEKGDVLKPKKIYTVVSNNYLVGHAREKYFGFSVADPQDTGLPLDLAMMEWLEKYKILDYKIEDRIIEITKNTPKKRN